VGSNAAQNSKFDNTVTMWVFEEMVDGRKLTDIINTDHENVKYLPGHKLPPNVVRNTLNATMCCNPTFLLCLFVAVCSATTRRS
jgi:glycerol-3-phosphate dehydrogenase